MSNIKSMKDVKRYLRANLKATALEIRKYKNRRKEGRRGDLTLYQIEEEIKDLKYFARHNHIVYCEFRGRTREQIEIPAKNNPPSQKFIDEIKEMYLSHLSENEQTIRTDS